MGKSRFLRGEWRAMFRNRTLAVALLGVMVIPLLYSSVYLWSFWDPYGKLSELPVAVVNSDQGAEAGGKHVAIGRDFTDKIKESNKFKWDFVTLDQAQSGLKDGKYYLAIEIPQNFSQNAMKVMDGQPAPAMFEFMSNEGRNFLASQIGRSAVDRMKGELSAQLTRAYAEAIFASIRQLSDGLSQAANGAQQLAQGSKDLQSGFAQFDQSMGKLAAGAPALNQGLRDLVSGAAQLTGGVGRLNGGAAKLADGLAGLQAAQQQLAGGAKQTQDGVQSLKQGLDRSASGAGELQGGAEALQQGLQQYAAARPDAAKDPQLQQLLAAAGKVAAGAQAGAAGQRELAAGAGLSASGAGQLAAGEDAFGGKLAEAAAAGRSVADGAQALAPGASRLEGGLRQAAGGAAQFAAGAAQLHAGAKQLADGVGSVTSGSGELSGKLADASQKTAGVQGGDAVYKAIADPVTVEEKKLGPVPNYGTGFSPYFLSLALFVGALMLTVVFPLRETAIAPSSGLSWFVSKYAVMLGMGALQAVAADLVLLYGIGLRVTNIPLFLVFSVIASWTSMALVQCLVTWLQNPGRFIAVILLVLQLTSSGGSYPVELIPQVLQRISPWLPMTHMVAGFKAVVTSGDYAEMWRQALPLAVVIIVFSLATLGYFLSRFQSGKGQTASQPAAV